MNSGISIFALMVLWVVSGGTAVAASLNAHVHSQVIEGLAVVKERNLEYGKIIANATSAGTVSISSMNETRTCSANLICSGAFSTSNFTVLGAPYRYAMVTFPGPITITNGTNTMLIDQIGGATNINVYRNTRGVFLHFNARGRGWVRWAGRLNVGPHQAPGRYTGSFVFTVEYP